MAVALYPIGPLVELASGVDALYLSGRAEASPVLLDWLKAERSAAVEGDRPLPLPDLGEGWEIEPRSFGRYRYRLSHPNGLVGITASKHLPAFRVQPRAEFIHGEGCGAVLDFFEDVCDVFTTEEVAWGLSRLDRFCDVQGWDLSGEDRSRFVCRSDSRTLREDQDDLTGVEFGQHSTKTVCARIYDKTLQVKKKGLDWWPLVWSDRYDRPRPHGAPPLNVAFCEVGLKESGDSYLSGVGGATRTLTPRAA